MSQSHHLSVMPTKLNYKLTIAFCLMSLLPNLVAVYIVFVFCKEAIALSPQNLMAVSVMLLSNIMLSIVGLLILRDVTRPIAAVAATARNIARGNLSLEPSAKGADEIEDLSRSLRAISVNAKDLLMKVENLSQKDKLTGLYTVSYIQERLHEEIERAIYLQRPCSFAYISIDHFESFDSQYGHVLAERAVKFIAEILSKRLSQFDRAAHIQHGEFAVIYPDKNRKKAIEELQALCKESAASWHQERLASLTISAGISENPIDGISAKDLYAKAQRRLGIAKTKGTNQIEASE